jgi:hypothetical protein
LDNKYFDFHRRYGFIKVTLLKIVSALFIIYALFSSSLHSGKLAGLILVYGIFVVKLLLNFIRLDERKKQVHSKTGNYENK